MVLSLLLMIASVDQYLYILYRNIGVEWLAKLTVCRHFIPPTFNTCIKNSIEAVTELLCCKISVCACTYVCVCMCGCLYCMCVRVLCTCIYVCVCVRVCACAWMLVCLNCEHM